MIVPTYETTAREQEIIINELRSINRTQENRISIQKEEIEKLKNIINELEKWLKDKIDSWKNDFDVSTNIEYERMATKVIYSYLQELKDSDKE